MPASPFDRIALAHHLCGSFIADFALLPRKTPDHVKLKLTFTDDSRLVVSEFWRGDELVTYSYYWLDAQDNLIIGWDNAPHHSHLSTSPHHMHVGRQDNLQPSYEHTLEAILPIIRKRLSSHSSCSPLPAIPHP